MGEWCTVLWTVEVELRGLEGLIMQNSRKISQKFEIEYFRCHPDLFSPSIVCKAHLHLFPLLSERQGFS